MQTIAQAQETTERSLEELRERLLLLEEERAVASPLSVRCATGSTPEVGKSGEDRSRAPAATAMVAWSTAATTKICSTSGRGVWIANSPEGTVSKIDTFAGVEVARYRTAPEVPMQPDDDPFIRGPFPSRTAVNLQGDKAVANIRSGSIVKIAARIDDCIDANGNGEIETSSGPLDVLPFGEDECVSWLTDTGFDVDVHGFQAGPRPVARDDGQHDRRRSQARPPTTAWVTILSSAARAG